MCDTDNEDHRHDDDSTMSLSQSRRRDVRVLTPPYPVLVESEDTLGPYWVLEFMSVHGTWCIVTKPVTTWGMWYYQGILILRRRFKDSGPLCH